MKTARRFLALALVFLMLFGEMGSPIAMAANAGGDPAVTGAQTPEPKAEETENEEEASGAGSTQSYVEHSSDEASETAPAEEAPAAPAEEPVEGAPAEAAPAAEPAASEPAASEPAAMSLNEDYGIMPIASDGNLEVTLTQTSAKKDYYEVGDTVTFAITVTNHRTTSSMQEITVTFESGDIKKADITNVQFDAVGKRVGWEDISNGWHFKHLGLDSSGHLAGLHKNGESTTITFDYVIKEADVGKTLKLTVGAQNGWGSHADVTATVNNIQVKKTDLKVEVKGETKSVPYNGETQTATGYTVTVTNKKTGAAIDSGVVTVSPGKGFEASGTDVATYPMTLKEKGVTVKVNNETVYALDSADVTVTNGSLTITPATLTITAENQTKEYDGNPLTPDAAKVEGLVGEDAKKVTVTTTGSVTDVGESVKIGYTINWNDVNQDNYDVKEELGTLTVTAKKVDPADGSVTVTAPENVMYKGKEQELKPQVQVNGTLLSERDYDLSYSADTTNVGTVKVTVTFKGNYSGEASTSYQITPAPLTVTIPSASKPYDGTPLEADPERAKIEGLVGQDEEKTVTVEPSGSVTNVGDDGTITYKITDWGGVDQKNYEIKEVIGTLKITAKSVQGEDGSLEDITVSKPEDVTYNGAEQKQPLEIKDGETVLTADKDYDLSYSNAVNAGTVEVTVKFKGNYDGAASTTYEIKQADVTLTAASGSKAYDGTALTADGYSIAPAEFNTDQFRKELEENYTITVSGSQTMGGSSDNVLTVVEKGDGPHNFNITTENGTLTVDAPALPKIDELKQKLGFYMSCQYQKSDGSYGDLHEYTEYEYDESFVSIGEVEAGTYDGYDCYYVDLTVNWENLCEKYSEDVRQKHLLMTGTEPTSTIRMIYCNADLKAAKEAKYLGWNSISNGLIQQSLAKVTEGRVGCCTYTVTYNDGANGTVFTDQHYYPLFDAENPHFNTGDYKNVVEVDEEGNPVRKDYVFDRWECTVNTDTQKNFVAYWKDDVNNDGIADNEQIVKITVIGKKERRTYNGNYQTLEGYDYTVTIGEGSYDAAEAEELGIFVNGPALSATGRDVRLEPYSMKLDSEYFSPYYYDSTFEHFNVFSEFKVTVESDIELTITPAPVTIKPVDASKAYDGTALTASGYEFVGDGRFYGSDADNYTFTYDGSQTGKGEGESTVTATLKDGKPANYAIQTQPGKLTVTEANAKDAFVVDTPENSMYDGTEHKWVPSVTDSRTNAQLAEGTDYTVAYSPNDFVNAGKITVTITGQGNYDGTITRTYQIAKRPIYLFATNANDHFTYNGEEQTMIATLENTVQREEIGQNVKYYTLAEGDVLSYVNGEAVRISAKNAVKNSNMLIHGLPTYQGTKLIQITRAGEDVSSNYTGQFRVAIWIDPRPVTLTSQTLTKTYDGTPLDNGDAAVEITGDGFVDGEGVKNYTFTGSQTLPGSEKNAFTYTLKEGTTDDPYIGNYKITTVFGDLTVTARGQDDENPLYEITMQPNSGTFPYDGGPHDVSGFEASTFTFNGVEFTVEGLTAGASATDAGTVDVTVTGTPTVKDPEGNDVTAQFNVHNGSATLTVTPAPVTVTAVDSTKVYGAADPDFTATVTGMVNGEDPAALLDYDFDREAGQAVGAYDVTPVGEEEQGNYTVTYVAGELTVTPAPVTVTANDATKVAGAADPVFTATVTGMVNGEDPAALLDYDFDRDPGEAAGDYAITPFGAAAQGNYTVTYLPGTLTITPAPAPAAAPGDGGAPAGVVIDDNPVPQGQGPDLQVNENGGEVTIDQDETPLAAAPTVGECCILHLIIMLCALTVAVYYTHDRKKRQKEEFETRFQMV